jgi:hypothetical protein
LVKKDDATYDYNAPQPLPFDQAQNPYNFPPQPEPYPQYTQPGQYPGYPQPPPHGQPRGYPPYAPPPKKDNKVIIAIVVIIVIFLILVPVFFYYIWYPGLIEGGGSASSVKISASYKERTNAYVLTITSVSGGALNLEDTTFEMVDSEEVLLYRITTGKTNPTPLLTNGATVYPIPSRDTPVRDISTENTVTANSKMADYELCFIAYIDQNTNGKISADDTIWIYKDYNADGTNEILSNYLFNILDADGNMVLKKQL